MCVCVQLRMHFRVMKVFLFKCISFFISFFILFKTIFYYSLFKAKPIRYCIELPV